MIGKRAGMDPGSLLLPLGFHLAEESGAQDGVGLPDVGQVHGQKLSPDFEAAILIYIIMYIAPNFLLCPTIRFSGPFHTTSKLSLGLPCLSTCRGTRTRWICSH